MDKQHFAVYKKKGDAVTKDGHTMFIEDVVKDLNRKSYLEPKLDKSPWISMEDEKAPANKSIDIWINSGGEEGRFCDCFYNAKNNKFWFWDEGCKNKIQIYASEVTHWMLFPAPPVK